MRLRLIAALKIADLIGRSPGASNLSLPAKLDILGDAVHQGMEFLDGYSVSTAIGVNNILFGGECDYLLIEETTEEYALLELEQIVHVFVKIEVDGKEMYLDGTAKPKTLKNALNWFKRTYRTENFETSVVKEGALYKVIKNRDIELFKQIEILKKAIENFRNDAHNDLYREAKSTWYTELDPVPSLDPEPFFDSVKGKKTGLELNDPKRLSYNQEVFEFQKRVIKHLKDLGYGKDKDPDICTKIAQDGLLMSPLYSRVKEGILSEEQSFKLAVKFYSVLKTGTKKDCIELIMKLCSLLKQGVPEARAYEEIMNL